MKLKAMFTGLAVFCLAAYLLDVPVLRLPVLTIRLELGWAFLAFIELCGGCLGRTPVSEQIPQIHDLYIQELAEGRLSRGFVVLAAVSAFLLVFVISLGSRIARRVWRSCSPDSSHGPGNR